LEKIELSWWPLQKENISLFSKIYEYISQLYSLQPYSFTAYSFTAYSFTALQLTAYSLQLTAKFAIKQKKFLLSGTIVFSTQVGSGLPRKYYTNRGA